MNPWKPWRHVKGWMRCWKWRCVRILFLCNAQKTRFYLLLMPGDKKFKTKDISKQIGSARLSFGSYEDMERLLDITPGSVSVTGLMNDARTRFN